LSQAGDAKLEPTWLGQRLVENFGEIVVGKRSAATGHGGSLGGDEPVELVELRIQSISTPSSGPKWSS
jgi:hypothetical protein